MLHALLRFFAGLGKRGRRHAVVEEVEPRVLYSADLNPALWADGGPQAELRMVAPQAAAPAALAQITTQSQEQRRSHEIVFVDAAVPDAQTLIDAVLAARGSNAQIEIVHISAGADGLKQITDVLAGESDLSAVHIISHGSSGQLQLGNGIVDAQTLNARADGLAAWRASLTADADILLYGCDVAQGAAGQAFVQNLARLTGADVAASADKTGSASIGGNWTLEFATGTIHTQLTPSTFEQLQWEGVLATYTVTSTNNAGAGSLRQAIIDANANAGADLIGFNIAGTGVHTIAPTSALPTITGTVTIDASTDDSFAANGNRPAIILEGTNAGAGTEGLVLTSTADGSVIRGLVIRDFGGDGIQIEAGSDNNVIAGNYIGRLTTSGTDAGAGTENAGTGIDVRGSNNTIGGTVAADRNVISGNAASGINIEDAGASGNTVAGNYIGLTAAGTAVLGNGSDGVVIRNGASGNTIGGATPAHRNVIAGNSDGVQISANVLSNDNNVVIGNYIGTDVTGTVDLGNTDDGVDIDDAALNNQILNNLIAGNNSDGIDLAGAGAISGTIIQGNLIGTAANGSSALGNSGHGIRIGSGGTADNTTIGGTTGGQGNTIAFNGLDGVYVQASTSVAILGNTIRSNTGQAIDLGTNGITANDAAPDADTGANNLQNFPALTSANSNSAGTTIVGTLNSNVNTTYRIEFYANRPSVADASNGEGERYLGFINVTTNGSGVATISATLASVWVNSGDRITATATNLTTNDTSEFAANVTAASTGIIVVDTTSDVSDGTTTSIVNLGNNRGADGRISLREAIVAANNTANGGSADRIVFNIPLTDANHVYYQNNAVAGTFGTPVVTTLADSAITDFDADYVTGTSRSWYRITLGATSNLDVTEAVVIDGSTQAGYDAAKGPVIEINAAAVTGGDANAIALTTGASTIRGLVINRAGDNAIEIDVGAASSVIVGNYIGTDVSGTQALGNSTVGSWGAIAIKSNNVVVGGTTAADRNLISGNGGSGIELYNAATGALIRGNYIGTTVTGITALGNATAGVDIRNNSANNTVGGVAAGQGNTIAFNGGDGVSIVTTISGNVVRGNSIHSNIGLAIDLNNDGVTANDTGDGDAGPNALKNFPVVTLVTTSGGTVTVSGTLNTVPSVTQTIDFYSSPSADGTGFGEGATYIGSTVVTTDGSGNASFSNISFAQALPVGHVVTAVTVDLASGNTSEFSRNAVAISSVQATITVDTTADTNDGDTTSLSTLLANKGADGFVSLREAIIAANNTANGSSADRIVFAIPAALSGGVHTINVGATGLPTITQAVIIDGTTEPDFAGTPMVELNGGNLGTLIKGVTLGAGSSGSTIRGLIINRFTGTGIEISGSNNHTIQGNWIGLDKTGTAAAANGVKGIYALNSTGNLIGGTTAATRNVISGNAQQGIYFDNVDNSTISGNYVGTDAAGTADVTPGGATTLQTGVFLVNGSSGNVIGGTTAAARNVLSGNNHFGFEVLGATSQNNLLQGNYIGTTASGLAALGNINGGAVFWGAGTGNIFGGDAAGARNVIAGNTYNGVLVGNASTGATIAGNYIGVGADGTTLLGNGDNGIRVEGASTATRIGTDANGTNDAAEQNVIAGNARGIYVTDAGTTGTVIAGNIIGLAADGNTIVSNTSQGISVVSGAGSVTIGGATSVSRNVISGNGSFGVYLGNTTSGSSVLSNYIGTNAAGTAARGNLDGVWIDGSANNIIGQVGAGNVISGSTYYGVTVDQVASTGNVIRANLIGLDATGTANLGNGAQGIQVINGASSTSIGGTTVGQGNTVAFNAGDGIYVSAGTGNSILGNSVYSNVDQGIDLGTTGVTTNDALDADTGANNLQNFPVLGLATVAGSQVMITGTLNSTATTQFRIEFFAGTAQDGSGYGEGQRYLGFANVTTDASGNTTISATLTATISASEFISATATRSNAGFTLFTDTSEFAQCVIATVAPVLSTTGTTLAYTENGAATAVDSGLTVSDADSTNLTGATVTISANYANGQDVLAFTNQLGITGSWNAGTGVLTLSGTTTVANYQTALRAVTYVNSSDNPSTLVRTVSFVVNDGSTNSNTATRAISVTAVNDAPVVTTTGTTLAYTENLAATVIDSGVTVSDADSANLASATATISANFATGQDTLAFTNQNGITGSWNSSTGVLTLSGSATVANYQTALRSITYVNTSDDPSTATRTVAFVVNDGSTNSATATRAIGVAAVNDAPTASNLNTAEAYAEDTNVNLIDIVVSDVDSANITATLTLSDPGAGSLLLGTSGAVVSTYNAGTGVWTASGALADVNVLLAGVTYLPTANYNGSFTIATSISDGVSPAITGSKAVTGTAVNDAPTLGNGTLAAVNEDTASPAGQAVSTIFTGQFADVDSGASFAGIAVVGNTANAGTQGSWQYSSNGGSNWFAIGTVSDGTTALAISTSTLIRFVPVADYNGTPPALTVRGLDNTYPSLFSTTAGSESRSTVNTTVNGGTTFIAAATASLSTSITAVNDAPVIATTPTALAYTENATATAIDPALTISDVDSINLTGATVSLSGNYANGQDVLAFTTQNGISGSWNAGTGVLTLSGSATVANYQTALRSITYVNSSDNPSTTTRTVSFVVNDGSANSNTGTRNIGVTAVNDAPVVTSDGAGANAAVSVAENTTAVTTVASSDVDGGTAVYSIVAGGDGAFFTINASTGVLSFITAPDFEAPTDAGGNNVYDVTVQVSDGSLTDTQAIAVTVTAVNDNAPVITSDGAAATAAVNVAENATAVTTVVATDADLPGQTLTYSISGGADAAKFAINASTGVLTFVAAPNFESPTDAGGNNVYDVTVQVSDGSLTDSQDIAVTVTAVNDNAPVITSDGGNNTAAVNVAENGAAVTIVTATDADLPGQTLTYSIAGGADAAKFAIDSSTGVLTFVAAPDFETPTDAGGNNVYDVTVQASDGAFTDTQAIVITVTAVNDNAPVITSNGGGATAAVSLAENTSAVATVAATDADLPAQTLTYSIAGGADAALFTINASTGALSFIAAPDFESPASAGANNVYDVIVQASDGSLTDTQAIAVTVSNANEAPVITSDSGGANASVSVAENASVVTTVASSDVDGGAPAYSIAGGADASLFTINSSTGALTFIAAPDFDAPADAGANNVYDVLVQVADGNGGSDTQAIAVTVIALNDNAPVITSNGGGATASVNIAENTSAITTVTASDADLPAQTLTYSISGGADAALFTINATTGALSFIVAPDVELPADVGGNNVYDVIVQASDGSLTDTQAIAVTVTPVNESAPVITSNGGGATASVSIGENNTSVTTVTATDADQPAQTLTYSIAGGADAALFTINASTGALSFIAPPNFEAPADVGADNVYDVTVQVSDGALLDTQAIAVTVSNVNEAPTITNDGGGANAGVNAAENQTAVTTITSTDVDGGAPVYSIIGGADAALFTINATTGVLSFVAAPNHEIPADTGADNIYDVTVQVVDGNGGSDTQAIAVTVSNVNEAPLITSNGGGANAAVSIAESTTAVTTVSSSDVDGGAPMYSISGGADAALFSVNSSTGALSFIVAPDFEAPADAGSNNVYDVIVQVTDGNGGNDTQAIAVTVTNVNDNAPVITSNGGGATASVSIAENGSAITTLTATDADLPVQTLTYSISGGADAALFTINATTGALSFIAAPDFEAPADAGGSNVYDVTVQVSDGNGGSDAQGIAVTVTAVNDNPPVIASNGGGATAAVSIIENGAVVATVTATDADLPAQTLTYGIAGGADAALFTINASTGALSFIAAPDFELPTDAGANNVYDVVVQVSDGSLGDSQAIAVTITNLNDNAPVITSNGGGATAALSIGENGSAVTTVTAADADLPAQTLTYSIAGGADAALFAIDASTGALSFIAAPNHEAPTDAGGNNVYDVTVQVDDGSGSSDTQAIAITVTNVNEAPVITSDGGAATASTTVAENSTAVTTVNSSDVDGGAPVYSIAGGADAALLTINAATGALSFVAAPDFEVPTDAGANNVYDVVVQVIDGNGGSDTQAIAVTVSALNDNAPVITSNGAGATAAVSVAENASAVTTVTATDADLPAQTLTYSIAGGADAALFSINASTGALSFIAAPDHEAPADAGADNVYDVIVQASDGGLSDTQAVSITVTNVNEAPAITSNGGGASAGVGVAENQAAVTSVTSTDVDGGAPNYAIVGGADATLFTINGATGALSFIAAPNFEVPSDAGANNVYDVIVQVADGNGGSDTQAIAVTVSNVNEAPVITSNGGGATASATVAENATAVTTITSSDVDGGAPLYSIADGADAALFTINATTGALSFVSAPDFEAPADAGANNAYDVVVQVSDGALTDTQAIAVTVTNVNDNLPIIASNGGGATASINIAENGSAVTAVTATDADLPAQTLAYSIFGGADAALFAVNSTTGALSFIAAPNHEAPADADADNVYELTVQASDGALLDSQAIRVTVTNANEAPSLLVPGAAALAENAAAATVVATVTASDPDAGELFSFALTADGAGRFTIDPASGRILVAPGAVLDFETQPVFDLTVRVTDASGLSSEQSLRVTLSDVLEAGPSQDVPPPLPAPAPAPAPAPSPVPQSQPRAPPVPTAISGDAPKRPSAPTERNSGASSTGAGGEDAARGVGAGTAIGFDGATQRLDSVAAPLRLPLRERDGTTGTAVQFALADIAPGSPAVLISAWDEAGGRGALDASQRNAMPAHRYGAVEVDSPGAERNDDGRHAPNTLEEVIQDPLRVSSVAISAGFIWWLTRSGGLLMTMLMGIPAWRHIDLLPVLARTIDEEDDDEETHRTQPGSDRGDAADSELDPTSAADHAVDGLFDRGRAAPQRPTPP